MNTVEAKKLNLPEIMSRLGHEPTSVKKGGNEYWYNSPFRPESEASFHTSFLGGKWIWNDFGDRGGTVIDFVMRHENYLTVSEALSFLDDMYGKVGDKIKSRNFSFHPQKKVRDDEAKERELEFISASKISSPIILSYLTKERGIDKNIIEKYMEEIRYRNLNNQKEYFAFGIKNESDGYEIRVASDKYPFKSALIKKDVTLIKGIRANGVVNLFEGMTDFMSLLTMLKTDNLLGDSILMHSLSKYERTAEIIESKGYQSINTFLDNNKAGRETAEKFKIRFGEKVSVQSEMFLPFEDINEMLQSQIKLPLESRTFSR